MEHAALIDVIRREAEVMSAVAPADLDVPTCPGWTLVDLYHHLGSVHRWQLAQLDADDPARLQPPPKVELPTDEDELVDWLLEGAEALTTRLETVGPDHLTPSWFGPRTATFWSRRAAHETAVHRWDAQATVTSPEPFPAEQAVDGLDELLEVIVPRRLQQTPWPDPPTTLHLHATDTDGEWMLRLDGSTMVVEHGHGKGDVAVRGAASDLFLLVLGRLPLTRLEVFGEPTVVEQWHATVNV